MQLRHSTWKFIKHNSRLGTHHHFRGICPETQPVLLYHTRQTEATPSKEHCCAGVIAGPTHGVASLFPYILGKMAWELTHTQNTCLNFVEDKPDEFISKITGT